MWPIVPEAESRSQGLRNEGPCSVLSPRGTNSKEQLNELTGDRRPSCQVLTGDIRRD